MKASTAYLKAAEALASGRRGEDTCLNDGRAAALANPPQLCPGWDLHTFMCEFYPHEDQEEGQYSGSPGLGTLALCFMIEVAKDEESKQEEEKKRGLRESGA